MNFFNFYESLPTKTDQKQIRNTIIRKCKIARSTFYTWLERKNIPDERALSIIDDIVRNHQLN